MRNPSTRQDLLLQAASDLSRGDAVSAAQRCTRLLLIDPNDVDALLLSGRSKALLGQLREAAGDLRRALTLQPRLTPALVQYGLVLALAGAYREAQPVLERARSFDPRLAEPHFGIGLCCLGTGDLEGAERAFREALTRNPQLIDARNNLGVVYDRLGRLAEAAEEFRRALALRPDYLRAHVNLGEVLLRQGEPAAAAAALANAARLRPQDAALQADLGAAQLAAGEFAAAAQTLGQALALDPRMAAAATNLGEALRRLGDAERARVAYTQALAINAQLCEAHLGLGLVESCLEREDLSRAIAHLLKAVELRPADSRVALESSRALERLGEPQQALIALQAAAGAPSASADVHDAAGRLLQQLGRSAAAAESFGRAARLDPARADVLLHLAGALESLGRYTEAIALIERARGLDPASSACSAALLSCAIRTCDWPRVEASLEALHRQPLGIDALPPFLLLATDWSAEEQAESYRRRGRSLCASANVLPARPAKDRLRIAYVSPDLREHPVAYALAGVIARHDRARFSPVAVSLTAPDSSEIAAQLRGAFEEVLDASRMSDREIVRWCREYEIDIAVDLAGHTVGARPRLFGERLAPVQVSYLGCPASSGLTTMEFIVADGIVAPAGDERLYTEQILRMPHCYLPFDRSRAIAAGPPERSAAGLPPQGFVFCAFNSAYKITRAHFELWLDLLADTPGSVLWLRPMGETASTNLREMAEHRCIDAQRLIFAPYLARMQDHLARLELADLFLDTLPYNAHTTASEALWATVPVLTCRGSTFAGRVGASVLAAAGLPELISEDLEAYRRQALELAHSPDRLAACKAHLRAQRATAPLFDTERYTRELEELLLRAAG